jgi:hypothetical protein
MGKQDTALKKAVLPHTALAAGNNLAEGLTLKLRFTDKIM